MEVAVEKPIKSRKKGLIKALVLLAFIIFALYVMKFTPVKEYLTLEALGSFINKAGIWAPIVYMIVYAVAVCLFVPGVLLIGLGAAIFGAYLGFLYVWIGAMSGAVVAFWIGRTLKRDFSASLIGDKLIKYDDAIKRNGFATVLHLRLLYFPFTPMNYGMGLTKVRFWDYFFGTGLGIIAGIFILTFFIGTLTEVWASRNWGGLISFKVFFSVGLFIFSFFIPKIINKIRGEV